MNAYDFPVELRTAHLANGEPIPGARAIVRSDTGIPLPVVVSDRYQLFTHDQAVKLTQPMINHFGEGKVKDYLERDGARFVREYTFQNQELKVRVPNVNEVVALRLSVINNYGLGMKLIIKLGAMVLRCLNGMTLPSGEFEIAVSHTKQIHSLELPHPDTVDRLFSSAHTKWNEWAERDVTPNQQDYILDQALKMHIVGSKAVHKFENLLDPKEGLSFWTYYNNFTNVLTHEVRAQQTSKLGRFDRLNAVFDAATLH